MRLLIAYDGSPSADLALEDLAHAGLPAEGDALVLSVAEHWLPPPALAEMAPPYLLEPPASGAQAARRDAESAARRVGELLPRFRVASAARTGSPSTQILSEADGFRPDLIVVGSQGRSAVEGVLLGSVSLSIVANAAASVRVVRKRRPFRGSRVEGERILVGFDGSVGSWEAIAAVARRNWPAGSEARLFTSIGPEPTPEGILWTTGVKGKEAEKLDRLWQKQEEAAAPLAAAKLAVDTALRVGDPRRTLLEEAEVWGASSLFVGATGLGRIERFLIGSVSMTAVTRAPCPVEVVRRTEGA